ncbi:ImmA/IrrE family metallo-endopeptidase [Leuconostoc lactis]|uniref:ImmA/IrrE family metallo-endopeptidase n=1 Tax=Leuconostoc lactis TaxID=1246 RepID=UPI00351E420A
MIERHLEIEITNALKEIACNHNIIVEDNINLSSGTPDFSVVNRQGVFMNKNFDTNVSFNFRLAHELSHLIYGNKDIQKIYTFSEFGHRHEELLAHKNAIRMLMSIEMPSSPFSFMNYYRIPSWLESDVIRTFNECNIVE